MKLPSDRKKRLFVLLGLLLLYFGIRFLSYRSFPENPWLESVTWLLLVFPVALSAVSFLEMGAVLTALVVIVGNVAIRRILGIDTNLLPTTIWVSWGASLLGAALLGYLARMTAALQERNERLVTTMREANHRIKNGLALARSVVSLEMNTAEGSGATEALGKVASRIDAIGAIHDELLWRREDRSVDLTHYLRRILEQLRSVLQIEIDHQLEEESEVPVDSEAAVRIGLITNELLTNMAKHDVTKEGPPRCSVAISRPGHSVVITVASDRGSLPEHPSKPQNGLGTRIVDLLVEQSRGTLTAVSRTPPVFELSVPLKRENR